MRARRARDIGLPTTRRALGVEKGPCGLSKAIQLTGSMTGEKSWVSGKELNREVEWLQGQRLAFQRDLEPKYAAPVDAPKTVGEGADYQVGPHAPWNSRLSLWLNGIETVTLIGSRRSRREMGATTSLT